MALDSSMADREYKKFSEVSGTTAINVNSVGGASGYAEGTTAGTITGNAIIFRGTGGTTTVVGTSSPLPVQEFYQPTYEDNTAQVAKVEQRYQYTNALAGAAGTVTVKASAGFLHNIVINKAVASGVLNIFDSAGTSANKIATITFGGTLLSDPPIPAAYNVSFGSALTIASSSAFDVTVGWR